MMKAHLLQKAILDVIDDGNQNKSWGFYESEGHFGGGYISEDEANNERLEFSLAVIERYRQLERIKLAEEGN